MTGLVERLRHQSSPMNVLPAHSMMCEAADRIEALEAAVKEARDAFEKIVMEQQITRMESGTQFAARLQSIAHRSNAKLDALTERELTGEAGRGGKES